MPTIAVPQVGQPSGSGTNNSGNSTRIAQLDGLGDSSDEDEDEDDYRDNDDDQDDNDDEMNDDENDRCIEDEVFIDIIFYVNYFILFLFHFTHFRSL